ncbi:GIY-YIG nuclease family protein [Jiella endophytica]|uniref:GIY-YIG nuclease family protein n=1 Tax=Jiella endophytica TaxID=2558362 RepID=A0A4Y8RPK4_9HYPH|nr:GIY-YIG nuclease family protein [Jiella endophytica]TFF24995.1 GIY-YIG nuclease family protein [Jiella endophytica]
MGGWVYIMASQRNGTLYVGVTSDLHRRVLEHREGDVKGFTARYGCRTLVWHERHDDIEIAIQRETSIKRYRRAWKLRLIEDLNPQWLDLFERFSDEDNPYRPSFDGALDDLPPEPDAPLDSRDGARE